ncbi:hypothetical protein CKO28_01510 [Rhodovibrio sodomensis]|uniref:Pre-toxin TG domain-containing protein n=1 Tax=Rhodovibrio sodomensis TaxID=1088 RepID=A0ABS1D9B3_9PROT|nr:hypothetical protein [Rhodovibrio sodomensis]MBK1666722.1 hypothetical protein [Rhodovibrio sodomensis]
MPSTRLTALIAGAALALTAISAAPARAVDLDCMALAEDVKRNLPDKIAMPSDDVIRALLNGQRAHRFFPRTEAHKQDGIHWKPIWTMSAGEVGALKRAVQSCADTVQTWGADLPFGQEGHRQRLSTAATLIDQFYVRATALKADKAETAASVEAQASDLVARASGPQGARQLMLAAKSVLEAAPTIGGAAALGHAQELVDAAREIERQRAKAKVRMIENAPHPIETYMAIDDENEYWRKRVDRVAESYVFVKAGIEWNGPDLRYVGMPSNQEQINNVIEGYELRAEEMDPIQGGLFILDEFFLGDWKEKAAQINRVFKKDLRSALLNLARARQRAMQDHLCEKNAPELPKIAENMVFRAKTPLALYQTLPQLMCYAAGKGYTPTVDYEDRVVRLELTHPNAHYFDGADPFREAVFDIVEIPNNFFYLHERGNDAPRGSDQAIAAWQSRYSDIKNTHLSLQGPEAY